MMPANFFHGIHEVDSPGAGYSERTPRPFSSA